MKNFLRYLLFSAPILLILSTWAAVAQFSGPTNPISTEQSPTINKWRPQIEVFNRIEDLATDTLGTSTNWTMVGGAAPLALTTSYAGNDRILHPDWVYIRGGFGGHRWWLVASPYPTNEALPTDYENPEIFYSDDGLTWTAIAGNPIDAHPVAADTFNADPSLLYDNGILYCYWTESRDVGATYSSIVYRTSTDGVTWSAEATTLGSQTLYATAAPVVRNVRGTYYLWVTDVNATPDVLRVRTSSSPVGPWGAATTCTLNGIGSLVPWHLNFTVIGDKIVTVGTFKATMAGLIGVSSDGTTFDFDKNLTYTGPTVTWDDAATYQFGQPIWNPEGQFFDVVYGGLDVDDADDLYQVGRGRIYYNRSGTYPIKRAAMNRILVTLGDCRGLWPFQQQSGTTGAVADVSLFGHGMTPSTELGIWATPPSGTGPFKILTFNGTSDGASLADDADFSLISGGNDIAFSAGAWVWISATVNEQQILCKWTQTGGREWRIYVDSAEKLNGTCYDESVPASELRTSDAAIPLDQWVFCVFTRDATQGDGCSSGFKLYVNGLLVASTATNDAVNVYVDMEDLAAPLTLGYLTLTGAGWGWFGGGTTGKMQAPFVCAKELTAAEVWSLYQDGKVMLDH